MDLLTECGLFTPLKASYNNFLQLSGVPISDLKSESTINAAPFIAPAEHTASKKPYSLISEDREPSAISFVRSRMMYARAALNAKGGVRFGMRHIRRSSHSFSQTQTLTITADQTS